ncbi:MAG: hypothetical protein SFU99_16435 [Saprospiraceae bacterium]|nr:hypothetical protein [Saprospiraceae bacterium]
MVYLKVASITFNETGMEDTDLYIGRFSRSEIENLLNNSTGDIFSVYFNQDAISEKPNPARITLAAYPGASTRDGGGDFEPCPPFCYPPG